ncbi:hypothetical protein OKA05_28150 [Luteolibacter arcticus]|uniref:Uncharacterized protein n=1 Tax=Luteolibacter arcticus TaxID=1581411 RepID=A0ABT3GSJ1_9BACT|nr:hypothetical protein [Luteolibacter arcticus]MCW1926456.1 hypothetical protein [Luteolibacter arcticus]
MKRKQSRVAGVIILLIVVVAAGWWLARAGLFGGGGPAANAMALKAAVATIRFDDGSQVEIYGLADSEWVDGVMTKPPGSWNMGSTGGSTSVDGDLKIERFTMGGKIAGVRYLPGEGRLVMSLRYLTGTGTAESPGTMKPGSLVLRLSDGGGLWIDGSGPVGADDDPQARGIVSFAGWPRSGKDLVFQATMKGQPPVEFRLPNPAAGSSPASWAATPLPQVKTGKHWEVRLVKAREITMADSGKGLIGDFEFSSDLPVVGDFPPARGSNAGVLGALGTRSMNLDYKPNVAMDSLAYPMPPDENCFKFLYRIHYDAHYPYPKRGIPMLLEGKVSPDGKRIEITSQHARRGIKSLKVGPVGAAVKTWYPASHQFSISFDGTWADASERSAAEAAIGPIERWTPVVFLDDEDHSSGSVQFKRSGTSSPGGSFDFDWAGDWSGELKPGMKVEIGLMARWPDEVLEFVVDRTSLSPK